MSRPRDAGAPPGDNTLHDSSTGESGVRPPERTRITQGTTIDRYVVLYELGSGGMGVVYAAYDPELDRKLALKLLHPNRGSSSAPQRLMREAKAIAQLTHPNVITVHDVGTFDGRVFVAMEFIGGVTLRQWIQQGERSWQEVVSVARKAGKGLAAAHAAGLIHRDYKPDNVMVEPGGRVIVLDFGLVRRAHSRHDDEIPSSHEESPMPDPAQDHLGIALTRGGAKLGTPAYMAPEQQLREPTDARSDQFSFCVVLWEALYGVRPFQGENATATALRVVRGEISEPPRGAKVPTWLRRVLTRGLSTNPNERYPSMAALLGDLDHEHTRDRRPWIFGGVALALMGFAGWAMLGGTTDPCAGALQRWAGIWDEPRREQVEAAFRRTATPYAGTAATGVARVLDGYVHEWAQTHREACEASEVRHEQSADLHERRTSCLDQRLTAAVALTAELAAADAAVVEHAVEAVNALPRIADCNDVAALSTGVGLPPGAATRRRVRTLRDTLADARAKESSARYEQALVIVNGVLTEAEALEYLPLLAEAHLQRGTIFERTGDFAAAEESLLEAIWAAGRSRHESVQAEAWVHLVWVTGVERMDTEQGHVWARFAEAALAPLGRADVLSATLTHNVAGIFYRERRLDEALAGYERALAEQRRLLGPDNPRVAMTLNHIGNVLIEKGEYATARELCEQSLSERRRVLGARHPRVAASLNNLGEIARKQEDAEACLGYARRSLDIVGGAGGPEERVASVLAAWALRRQGRFADASEMQARVVAIDTTSSSRHPEQLAGSLRELGHMHLQAARPQAAAEAFQRAIAVEPEPSSRGAVEALIGLAHAHMALGHGEAAHDATSRAAAMLEINAPKDADLRAAIAELEPAPSTAE